MGGATGARRGRDGGAALLQRNLESRQFLKPQCYRSGCCKH